MKRSHGARLLLALLSLCALAILTGLGTWQLQRLAWKEALIAAASERPGAAAVAAPGPAAWPTFDLADWNYRRVRLTGRFAPGEVYAWTLLGEPKGGPHAGAGYYLVSPFVTDDGFVVLVNRGFVPEDRKAAASRPGSAVPDGPVTLEGIVRRDDPPGLMTPAPDPATGIWFSRDIATIAAHLGVPEPLAPYSVDLVATQTPPGGLPQAGESQITFANSHLQYALTWYGLAAALVGVWIAALWSRRRKRATPAGTA
ncbi:MAG: SURF1 family protein [Acuticoccus sp.]